jgi:CRISPR/Cas system-associated endonuclease/helicase Cas3
MRYQQKQMQENAQKKSDMFDETQKLLTSSLGAGKVSFSMKALMRKTKESCDGNFSAVINCGTMRKRTKKYLTT